MSSGTVIWMFLTFYSISNLGRCHSYVYDRAKVVTYGEPCFASRQFPIKIEGPKASIKEQKIPVSLDLKVVSDMFVHPPRRVEYPITIKAPCTTHTAPSLLERVNMVDSLRGKSYAYNTYVPPVEMKLPPVSKNYNFAVDVPLPIKETVLERSEARCIPQLKGLTSRVDRILIPACEVSSSYQH